MEGVTTHTNTRPHILLITTADSSYPGADTVGQMHLNYPTHTSVIRIPDPVMLPERFYLYALKRGFDAIIVMSSGAESPFEGTYDKLARRLDGLTTLLKSQGIDYRRIKLCSICTVCTAAFLREVKQMSEVLEKMGPLDRASVTLPDGHPQSGEGQSAKRSR
ncbi:hydrogenase iron-sulfur subunit [Candidatus Bipolaricaulota bacterium]|nr:hydrogenase iron-sulfur subunit [Candidatus Bipolaricaulota bacterium]